MLRSTWMVFDRAKGTTIPSVLVWGQCGVPTLVRAGMLGGARSLPVPLKGQDRGEVVRSCGARGEG
jgi:hypothetical protein